MTDDAIVADNIRAVGAFHFSAMLDAMKAYDVVDRLVELAFQGRLPLQRGESSKRVDHYFRSASDRMSAVERRRFYVRTLGVPGGAADGEPNREFDGLWSRFVAAVAEFARQQAPAAPPTTPPRPGEPPAVGQEQVRTRAKALAQNLSTHGEGLSVLARILTAEISELVDMLRIRDFQEAFGARDMWGLVERVSSQELGRSAGVARRRIMAEQGMRIFAWLANRPPGLWVSGGDALDVAAVTGQQRSAHPTSTPTDYDLVDACEQWLAATGIGGPEEDEPTVPGQTHEVLEAVGTLLSKSAAFAQLAPAVQTSLAHDTARVAEYLSVMESPSRLREFVEAVDFPQFVADLIDGMFDAMVDASIQQLHAYADLLAAAAASIDDFRRPHLEDREVLSRLCDAYPRLCEGAAGSAASTWSSEPSRHSFETPDLPAPLDRVGGAAWRRLASSRQQLLATLVIMALDRKPKA
jgi:hypothetical protein